MAEDNVNDRLTENSHGIPRVKPDEQRKYLGTFRERVALTLNQDEAQQAKFIDVLHRELDHHPEYQLLINGNSSQTALNNLTELSDEVNNHSTVLGGSAAPGGIESLAAVVCAKDKALHIDEVDASKRLPQ